MRLALLLWLLPAVALARGPGPTDPVRRGVKWWTARHRAITERLQRGHVELVFLGDSITEGWDLQGSAIWQTYYAKRHAVNMGISGDETGHVLWRLAHSPLSKLRPRVVVLLIGVNSVFRRDHSAAAIAAGVAAVVKDLRRRLPGARILLLGVFPAGARPGPLRQKIEQVNRRIRKLGQQDRVRYLDIGQHFLEPDGRISRRVMSDHLHLTARGYRIWAKAMEPTLRQLLGEKKAKGKAR